MVLAIAAIATFSCAKEIDNNIVTEETKTVTLTANVDANPADIVGTKTYLDGVDILWSGSEVVRAYGILNYDASIATLTPNKKVATFNFEVDPGDEIHYGIYPAANAGNTDESSMTVTIPAIQTATAGSFDPMAMAAIGRVLDGGNIGFKNVGALLSIVINNDDIKSVELSATEASGYSMTGTAAIEINGSDEITTVTDGSSTSVKLTGGLVNGETYYFVVYPGEYSNLRIVVTDKDDAIAVYRNKTPFSVGRNQNWKIAELTIPAGKWVPAEVDTQAFYESFDKCDGTGGNDNQWSGSIATVAWDTATADNDGWTKSGNAYKAKECLRIGKVGSVTTPALGISDTSVDLSFKAAAWDGSSEKTRMKVSVVGTGKIKIAETEYTEYSFDIVKGSWSTIGAKITGANSSTKLTFSSEGAGNDRFFLDEVEILTKAARDDNPVHYTVTYNANTGTGDAPTDDTDYNDQTNFIVTVAGQGELTKKGYSFNGWNTAADGSGTAYAAGATFIIKSNVTLYAQWSPIAYTITKNVNAHCSYTVKAGGVEVSTATYGTTLTLEAGTPDTGYSFLKFHIDYTKDDSTPGENNFTVSPKTYSMPASNITITLVLDEVKTYTVTWKVGASTYKTDVLTEGDDLTLPTNPNPEEVGYSGYNFIGWTAAASVNPDGTSIAYAANGDPVTADVTYHAVFAHGSTTPASIAEVSSSYTLTVGDELVIVAHSGTSDFGLYEETINSSYVKNFAFTESASDIAGSAKKHWTVSKVDDNYYLGDSTNGYLYTSGSNNLATNTSSMSPVTLAYDSTEAKFTIVMNNRRLSCRTDLIGANQNLWRMGGASIDSPSGTAYFKIYKFTPASGSYSDYTL